MVESKCPTKEGTLNQYEYNNAKNWVKHHNVRNGIKN